MKLLMPIVCCLFFTQVSECIGSVDPAVREKMVAALEDAIQVKGEWVGDLYETISDLKPPRKQSELEKMLRYLFCCCRAQR